MNIFLVFDNKDNCNYSYDLFNKKMININKMISKLNNFRNVSVININDLICDVVTCNFFYNNNPIIYDKIHFNQKFIELNKAKIIKKFNDALATH